MTSGKEVFNERCRNSQGEMKRDHDFLEGKIYAKLREGIGNILRVFVTQKHKAVLIKKNSLSISDSWSALLTSALYSKLRNAIIGSKMEFGGPV